MARRINYGSLLDMWQHSQCRMDEETRQQYIAQPGELTVPEMRHHLAIILGIPYHKTLIDPQEVQELAQSLKVAATISRESLLT